jgi:hypothetical protein
VEGDEVSYIREATGFPGIELILRVDLDVSAAGVPKSHETRHFIASLSADEASPEQLLRWVRGHWCVEIPQPEDSQSDNLCAVGRAGYHRLRRPVGVGRVERQQLSGPRRYLMRNSESACVPPRPRFLRRTH